MKKTNLLLILSVFAILMSVLGTAAAQDEATPAFKVSSVATDEKIVLTTKDFPAETSYTVSMSPEDDPENYTPVAKFNTKNGGKLNITIKIPAKFQGLKNIELKLEDENGGIILGNFANIPEEQAEAAVSEETVTDATAEGTPEQEADAPQSEISLVNEETTENSAENQVTEPQTEEEIQKPMPEPKPGEEPKEPMPEPKPGEEPKEPMPEPKPGEEPKEPMPEPKAEEETEGINKPETEEMPHPETTAETVDSPILLCDFNIVPKVQIDAVVRNDSVTFTTADFPANSSFTVSMGVYVPTWAPQPRPNCPVTCPGPIPFGAQGRPTTAFSGTEAGTFETGDGAPQTLTFSIPESLYGVNPIALWISDNGPCGFYSYNYFYNNTTN